MCNSAREHDVDESLVLCIKAMLTNRTINADADCGQYVMSRVNRGCPQGGVLSPLLWCMLVDSLLNVLNGSKVYTQAYDVSAVQSVGSCLADVCSNAQANRGFLFHEEEEINSSDSSETKRRHHPFL